MASEPELLAHPSSWSLRRTTWFDIDRALRAARAAGPPLLYGIRLWASVCLALYIAFWLELDNAYWAGTTAAIVCQPKLGASLRKGWFRMIGTIIGAVMIVVLTACFPQDRGLFLLGLALWAAACAFVATLLHNFASYSAALAGYTAVIIASDELGATGGVNGDASFMLAVFRVSEICIGIVSAGIVLAGTDLGGARRRLAAIFSELAAGIGRDFTRTLALAGPELPDMQEVRREFLRQAIALDPLIDETLGESSRIRYHSSLLQKAVDGLFAALCGWRAVANHLVRLPHDQARAEAAAVLQRLPPEPLSLREHADPTPWTADPTGLRRICEAAARGLLAVPAGTPSLRLLADEAAKVLAGISDALNGLALLVADPAQPVPRRGSGFRLSVPDWLPALVNAARAFVTIGAVALFWIVTVWPSGAQAITFAAITVILFAPRADQSFAVTVQFAVGTLLAAVSAAILNFAVLPWLQRETFAVFAVAIGLYLVPTGALAAQPWKPVMFTAMSFIFLPLLAPANVMTYDPLKLYNASLAIVGGTGVGALAFRLLPSLSPAYRTRRLLRLTMRDLRRLAMGRTPVDWDGHILGRLSVMPDEATPLQRAQLLVALSVGTEIIALRQIMRDFELSASLDQALSALAQGESATATARLARLDAAFAARAGAGPEAQTVLRARGGILALSEGLTQHAAYFDEAGAPA